MSPRILTLVLGLNLAMTSGTVFAQGSKSKRVHAQAKVAAKVAKTKGAKGHPAAGHLSTDVNFGDSVLRGQYQAPAEALAKVENEKGFGDLIGVRKHFKDRLNVAADQE